VLLFFFPAQCEYSQSQPSTAPNTGVKGRYGVLGGDPADSSISQENTLRRRPCQMLDGMLNIASSG